MPPRSVCARVLRRDEKPTTNGIRSLPHLSLMVLRCQESSVRGQRAARSRSLHSLYDLTTEPVQMTTSSSDPRGVRLLWILISLSAMALAGCKEKPELAPEAIHRRRKSASRRSRSSPSRNGTNTTDASKPSRASSCAHGCLATSSGSPIAKETRSRRAMCSS